MKLPFTTILAFSFTPLSGAVLLLDGSNDWTITLEPGVTISQPFREQGLKCYSRERRPSRREMGRMSRKDQKKGMMDGGPIVFSGAVIGLGVAGVVEFNDLYSSIGDLGWGQSLSPDEMVERGTEFTIRANASGNLYNARLLFFNSPGGEGFGLAPGPDHDVGAVFEIRQVAIPEPSTSLLGALAGILLLRRRVRA